MYRLLANFYRNNKIGQTQSLPRKAVETKPDNAELAKVYQMIGKNYDELKNSKKMMNTTKNPWLSIGIRSGFGSGWITIILRKTMPK
jgi:hypothetical protein